MEEKILQKLISQRGENKQVTDKTLQSKAKVLSKLITTDEILDSVDFTEEIASMQGNIAHIAANAVKSIADKAAEEKRIAELAEQERLKALEGKKPDVAAENEAMKAMMAQMAEITSKLQNIETEKATTGRKSQLDTLLKDVNPMITTPILTAFNANAFESDSDFETYLSNIGESLKKSEQLAAESSIQFRIPTTNQKKEVESDGQTPELAAALAFNEKK